MAAQEDEPDEKDTVSLDIRMPPELATSVYATGSTIEAGEMVWLDFVQPDSLTAKRRHKRADDASPVTIVARVVLTWRAARALAEDLAELREPTAGAEPRDRNAAQQAVTDEEPRRPDES